MIPLAVPNLTAWEAAYLQECVTSTFVSSVGPFVGKLERQVAAAAGTAQAVATSSGTAGLHLALRAVGVGPGDLVVLPSFTFIASANAITYCGASPWLFDVTETSWTLDPEQLARTFEQQLTSTSAGPVLRRTGQRVAAIMPVHALGHPAGLAAISKLGAAYEIPIVADAAAALGARFGGLPIGRAGAACSVFSFNGNKTVTAGGGGALAADDTALLDRARHLSTTARLGRGYDHDAVGFNYRLTNIQAAVGCAQLDHFVTIKRRIRRYYTEQLADLSGARPFPVAVGAERACWFSGLVFDPDVDLEQLRADLRARDIDARPFWKPVHLQQPYAAAIREPLPATDRLWHRILPLPCSTGITDAELRHVVSAVRESVR